MIIFCKVSLTGRCIPHHRKAKISGNQKIFNLTASPKVNSNCMCFCFVFLFRVYLVCFFFFCTACGLDSILIPFSSNKTRFCNPNGTKKKKENVAFSVLFSQKNVKENQLWNK